MADALPGIGIVAAVLGIIVTMAAISGPVEQVGEHVGAALTGTMLGVFFAYVVGKPAGPVLHVNPLSALAPGLLRKVFEFPANNPYTPPSNDDSTVLEDNTATTSRGVH